MQVQMKQRLVGLLVLIGLLAICLPLIFFHARKASLSMTAERMPSPPKAPEVSLSIALESSEPANPVKQVVLSAKETVHPVQAAEAQSDQPTHAAKQTAVSQSVQLAQASRAAVKPAAPTRKESSFHTTRLPQAWSVLLGTFSQPVNAERLAKKIRKQGYEAYVRTFSVRGKSFSQVYVGPDISKARAQKVRQKLQAAFGLKGVLKQYRV